MVDPTRPQKQGPSIPGRPEQPEASRGSNGPPLFPHPQWIVGVVLIFAVLFIVAGLGDPVWLLIGSPFILALAVYAWMRLVAPRLAAYGRRRR